MRKYFLFIFFSILSMSAFALPGVVAVDGDHYISKMPGQEVYLIAERLTPANLSKWESFVKPQANMRVSANLQAQGLPPVGDGAKHFLEALKEYGKSNLEQWVICATLTPQLPVNMDLGNVLMYMTVNTTPQSMVTTHMGIAGAVYVDGQGMAKQVERPKGISMDLHSFAAKVMLMLNPNRKFMINIPVYAMAQIILKEMPKGSVHYDTFENYEALKSTNAMTFEDYLKLPETQKTIGRITAKAQRELKSLKEDIESGHLKSMQEIQEDIDKKSYLVPWESNGKFDAHIDESKLAEYVRNMASKNYANEKSASLNLPAIGRDKSTSDRLAIIEANPPIIHGSPSMDTLEVMDPNDLKKPLFKATKSDPVYGYLFLDTFRTFGMGLNYVAVDLDKLAALRPVDTTYQYKKP